MSDVVKATIAGAVATAALSAVMLLIGVTGFEPQLELTRLLLAFLDVPTSQYALGWTLHIIIGAFGLGGLFAYIERRLGADTHAKSGILFGVLAWLVVSLVIMPVAGYGYFGFGISRVAPIIMLGQQVLYGAILGWTYGKLQPTHNPFTKQHPA